jgi:hypothetical protein
MLERLCPASVGLVRIHKNPDLHQGLLVSRGVFLSPNNTRPASSTALAFLYEPKKSYTSFIPQIRAGLRSSYSVVDASAFLSLREALSSTDNGRPAKFSNQISLSNQN